MLLISISRLLYAKCTRVKGPELQNDDRYGGDVHLTESIALQNDREDGSMPDQHLHEIRGDESHNAYVVIESVTDVENGLVHNGLNDGSITADSVQIDTSTSQAEVQTL